MIQSLSYHIRSPHFPTLRGCPISINLEPRLDDLDIMIGDSIVVGILESSSYIRCFPSGRFLVETSLKEDSTLRRSRI